MARTRHRFIGLTVLALGALHAHAAAQPRQETAPRFGALRTRNETALEVRREVVELRCDESTTGVLDCDVTVRTTVGNGGAEPITTAISVTVERTTPFTLADGGEPSEAPVLRPRDLAVDAGSERELVLVGHLQLGNGAHGAGFGSAVDGLRTRHPLVATEIHQEQRRVLYARPVRRDYASMGAVEIHAFLPVGWLLHSSTSRFEEQSGGEGEQVLVRQPGPEDAAGSPDVEISLEHGAGADPVRNGGPYLALGGTFYFGNAGAIDTVFRGRVGYEIGILDFLVIGASVETDFRNLVNVAVLLEAATWSMIFPPGLSAGIGPIFQLLDNGPGATTALGRHNAGLRLAAGAIFYSVGFDATFDVFPADGHWEITLAGRAGL